MKTTLVIGLLATALLGMAPTATAADCSDPGTPGPGAVGAAEWYALRNAYLACTLATSVELAALENGGIVAAKATGVATGGLALVHANGLVPAATAFTGGATGATVSEAHDGCGAFIGDNNPTCGSDPAVSQAQQCAAGLAVPNPIPDGLGSDTLANANGALQATCALANAAVAAAPTQGEVTGYAGATVATALSLNGDAFNLGSAVLNAACQFATGTVPCV